MNAWTTKAKQRWDKIPADKQALIRDHVWCPHCGESRRAEIDGGTISAGDLVITGTCMVCGHRTARLLEGEPRVRNGDETRPRDP